MEGRNDPSHRTQGGSHGQYNRATPRAVDLELAPRHRRCPPSPTHPTAPPESAPEEADHAGTAPPGGPQGRPELPPAQAALRPAPPAGPHRLRAARPCPDPAHLSPPRPAGAGRHPYGGRAHHRQLAPWLAHLG